MNKDHLIKGTFGVSSIIQTILGTLVFIDGYKLLQLEMEFQIYISLVMIVLSCQLWLTVVFTIYYIIRPTLKNLNKVGFLHLLVFITHIDYSIISLINLSTPYSKHFLEVLENVIKEPKKKWAELFDYLHQQLECCGVNGPEDFQKYHNLVHPVSCCSGHLNCTVPKDIQGCAKSVENYSTSVFIWTGSYTSFITGISLFVFILAYIVMKSRKRNQLE